MKITKLVGREIYDSCGWPTIQCDLEIDGNCWVSASVPSGIVQGRYEAVELHDGGSRLWGRGVLKAIEHIEYVIAPALVGMHPNGPILDRIMLDLDATTDKSHLGSNAILAVSMAVYRAHAMNESIELFELIAQVMGQESVTMPFPQYTIMSGGAHMLHQMPLQEMLVVPVGMHHFRSAMEKSVMIFHEVSSILTREYEEIQWGSQGSYAPQISIEEALTVLCEAIGRIHESGNDGSIIALDMDASQLFDPVEQLYCIEDEKYTTDQLIAWYEKLLDLYPIYSLEDPFAQEDWQGWRKGMAIMGDRIQIVSDALTTTNIARVKRAIEERCVTAVTIKPNQVGTITEALEIIQLCKTHGINTVISHRSGETNDAFIADLAVGVSAGQIKAGGCSRGERLAKYNRLLTIEDLLFWGLLHIDKRVSF